MSRGAERRRRPAAISESTRTALFVLGAAAASGFRFRAAGAGKLEVEGPADIAPERCEPVLDAIRANGAEIQRLLRWFDDERRHGRFWRPRLEPRGAPQ
jgi:hypothetical protein